MNDAIVIRALSKRFPKTDRAALSGLNLSVKEGEITGLVGPDGAGKTTLLRLIVGLLKPTSGSVYVHGLKSEKEGQRINEITGYMPQKFGLYSDLSVIENLKLCADMRRLSPERQRRDFEELLEVTRLSPFQSRLTKDLSGGMKQKLSLACALLGNPRVLLLDEPGVGVDPASRKELWELVKGRLSDKLTVLWSTAYLDEAQACDTTILLNEGEVLHHGSPQALMDEVKDRVWVLKDVDALERRAILSDFLKQDNIRDGSIRGRHIRLLTAEPIPPHPNAIPDAPTFEDAFIDRLGGNPFKSSALGDSMEKKPEDERVVIEALHLTKRFGSFTAVSDNTFKVGRGEIFGLLGPNGAGKSTTFKMMCGLLKPDEGHSKILDLSLQENPTQARSKLGYMAQKFSLYDNLSALQNLNFFAEAYGLFGQAKKARIDLMVKLFGMEQHLHMPSFELPLGFKQRTALSCALLHEPDVLFIDEPTSGVDPITRREFWMHINAMAQKGMTVLVTTHFMDEAEYCDRVGLIYRGKTIAQGTPDELKALASKGTEEITLEEAFIRLIRNFDEETAS